MKIITHSGAFHSDEIFATALLLMYVNSDMKITRTRDKEILKVNKKDNDSWVIDVGGVHDPDLLNFDHHQKEFEGCWQDGSAKSSFGLIWSFLIEKKIINIPGAVRTKVENSLVKKIDLHDNGVRNWFLAPYFSMFNRGVGGDEQFLLAVNSAKHCISNYLYKAIKTIEEEEYFQSLLQDYNKEDDVFISDKYLSTIDRKLSYNTKAKVYVMPGKNGKTWTTHSVSETGRGFSSRCLVPKELRGIYGKQLEEMIGLSGIEFIHKNGFIVVSSTREIAIAMAIIMSQSKLD